MIIDEVLVSADSLQAVDRYGKRETPNEVRS